MKNLVELDFLELRKYCLSHTIAANTSSQYWLKVKTIHEQLFPFMYFPVKRKNLHKEQYLNSIISNVVNLMGSTVFGLRESSLLLCRLIIENFLKHVYYSDHPVEFSNMATERMSIKDFKEYLVSHPKYDKKILVKREVDVIANLYSELSVIIHNSKPTFHSHMLLNAIKRNSISVALEVEKYICRIAPRVLFLLIIFEKDIFQRRTKREILIIQKHLSREQRALISSL